MTDKMIPTALVAAEAPSRVKKSLYPSAIVAALGARLEGRDKRPLGDLFGLHNFGVNLTRLTPGAISALRHAHAKQDEFIYILEGYPTLYTDEGPTLLAPGMCAGFKAGTGNAHHLVNISAEDVLFLEIGDRTPDDRVSYPDDDLQANDYNGRWAFARKDGTPFI
jgi:uncharacterized cupin superfamily protein